MLAGKFLDTILCIINRSLVAETAVATVLRDVASALCQVQPFNTLLGFDYHKENERLLLGTGNCVYKPILSIPSSCVTTRLALQAIEHCCGIPEHFTPQVGLTDSVEPPSPPLP